MAYLHCEYIALLSSSHGDSVERVACAQGVGCLHLRWLTACTYPTLFALLPALPCSPPSASTLRGRRSAA